jgi:hypothetical protein
VVAYLERELEKRTAECHQVTSAFEHFLKARLKAAGLLPLSLPPSLSLTAYVLCCDVLCCAVL